MGAIEGLVELNVPFEEIDALIGKEDLWFRILVQSKYLMGHYQYKGMDVNGDLIVRIDALTGLLQLDQHIPNNVNIMSDIAECKYKTFDSEAALQLFNKVIQDKFKIKVSSVVMWMKIMSEKWMFMHHCYTH